jgi:hypothetical protein
MEGERISKSCAGHEELRDIALGTRNDVKHLQESVSKFMLSIESHEIRVRYLEINGAKISQENAIGLKDVVDRVDVLEGFKDGHQAAEKETSKLAAIVAGIISTVGVLIGIGIAVFSGGR